MMLDATQNFKSEMTEERLFGWHASLFPTGRSGMSKIIVGAWRDEKSGPMRVVSGAFGREKVHYEAPAAGRLDAEMKSFLEWFNAEDNTDPVIKAALAHLWFVTIHPFAGWQRPDCTRDRRYVACPLGRQFAAFLQHVRANPHRAESLLRHA